MEILLIMFVVVSIIEPLLFGVLYSGWSSYVYILIENGFYFDLCMTATPSNPEDSILNNSMVLNSSIYIAQRNITMTTVTTAPSTSCKEQQEQLLLLYSISVALVCLFVVSWGPLIYRFGLLGPKLWSIFLISGGSLLLGFANKDTPLLIVPGLVFVGVGGVAIILLNIKVSSFLPFGTGLYVAVLNGAMDSSVITFRMVKLAHDFGIPSKYPFIFIALLEIVISGTSLLLHRKFEDKEKKAYNEQREQTYPLNNGDMPSSKDTDFMPSDDTYKTEDVPTIKDSICTIFTFTMMMFMSIIMLNFLMYVGTINKRLQNKFPNEVSRLTNILAYCMMCGILISFITGGIIEWQRKTFKDSSITERKLLPNVLPLTITSFLSIILNVLHHFESMDVLYLEFVVLTTLRSFLFSTATAFCVSVYPLRHSNVLFSIYLTIGGLFSMTQYAIFIWYNISNQSQVQVNIFMTILSALSLVQPMIIYLSAKGYIRRKVCTETKHDDLKTNPKL